MKPKKCPECGSNKVLKIVYGLVLFVPEGEFAAGCTPKIPSPLWHCGECDWEWGPDVPGEYNKPEEE